MNMFNKILTWIKGVATWAKVITTIVAAIGVISGGALFFKSKVITKYEEQKQEEQRITDLQEAIEALDTIKGSIDLLSWEMSLFRAETEDELNEANEKIDYLIRSDENLRKFMTKHALDKDGMLEVLDIWDVKKNSTNKDDMIVSER